MNVRKIVEDLGHLILYSVRKSIFPIQEICESVERSNHLKKKVRILEGRKARVEKHNAGLSLIFACTSLRECPKEVPTFGIILSQLLLGTNKEGILQIGVNKVKLEGGMIK